MNERIAKVLSDMILENQQIYQELFSNTELEKCSDNYMIKAINLYRSLNESNQEILLSIVKQVTIDTVSNLLGIFDGSVTIRDDLEFKVIVNEHDTECELQDTFLAYLEDIQF